MIIIKIICLFLIFFISTQIGFQKANTYKTREKNLIKLKIEYSNETIKEIFNQISKIIYEEKENIFLHTITNLEKDKLFENWYIYLQNEKILKEDDKEILKIFGKNLGKLDRYRTNKSN